MALCPRCQQRAVERYRRYARRIAWDVECCFGHVMLHAQLLSFASRPGSFHRGGNWVVLEFHSLSVSAAIGVPLLGQYRNGKAQQP